MPKKAKTAQLQIRVTPNEKERIKKRAEAAGLGMSDWVLRTILPDVESAVQELVAELATSEKPGYVFAALLDLLEQFSPHEFELAVGTPPDVALTSYWAAYLAATIEYAAARKGVMPPRWTSKVPGLDEPVFGSSLQSVREYLLTHSPPPFAKRNIFVESSVGQRV